MNRAERRQQKKLAKQAAKQAKKSGAAPAPTFVNADALVQKALRAHQNGRVDEAEALYQKVLSLQPDHFDACHLSGVLAYQRGRQDEAISLISKAIDLNPNFAEARNNLASVLMAQGRFAEAEASLQKAVALKADYAEAHFNLGNARLRQDRLADAVVCYRQALALNPEYLLARLNLANVLRQLGELTEAEEMCRILLIQAPSAWEAHNTYGVVLLELGRVEEALAHFDLALKSAPDSVEALHNRGIVLVDLGRYADAEAVFMAVLERVPEHPDAHVNLGLLALMQGRYAEGWRHYAYRRAHPRGVLSKRQYAAPLWDGGDLGGKRLFVYPEQGIGDFLQCVRFVPRLSALGADVVLEVPASLTGLVKDGWGGASCIAADETPPDFDCHASVMDLPAMMNLDADALGFDAPYLHADPDVVAAWTPRLGDADSKTLRIGVVWAGNPTHKNDRNRSIAAGQFAALLDAEGARFFSLQVGRPEEDVAQMGEALVDLQSQLTDYAQTAGVIANLDLVISVDTSVAHLAGALGKPVWTLLPAVPDWRWGLAGETTPWYPGMRLFRQGADGDWGPVLKDVRHALTAL